MWVVAHVSSRKTSRSGSSAGCAACHSWRLPATSGRSCSAARRAFFYAQSQGVDGPPQGRQGDGQAELVAEFLQGGVGGGRDGSAEPIGVGVPARLGAGGGGAWGEGAVLASALLEPSDPGLADVVLGGNAAGTQAAIAVGEHPPTEFEGVGLHGISSGG